MSASQTVVLTTLASEEPAPSSIFAMLPRISRVSLTAVPCARSPVAGSTAIAPDMKMKSPAFTAVACGSPNVFGMSSLGSVGARPARLADIVASSGRRYDVELHLQSGLTLRAPDRAAGRRAWQVLPVDAVEHVVLDAIVDQCVHL